MPRRRRPPFAPFVVAIAATLAALAFARAGDGRGEVGDFDYYALALSWSPSFCKGGREAADTPQCGREIPFGFIVHGLWPQFEDGFPAYCDNEAPGPDRQKVAAMLDIMPSAGLVRHQWRKHGTCSALAAAGYFATIRAARALLNLPALALTSGDRGKMSPERIEAAFLSANPGLRSEALTVTCRNGRLAEVRICLTKRLGFRPCAPSVGRACPLALVTVPPIEGR